MLKFVKSLFNDKNNNTAPEPTIISPLAKHNNTLIDALQNNYYLSNGFNLNETSAQGPVKKLPVGLSMNEQKQKIIQDMLNAAKAKADNNEIIDLKQITEILETQYQGTPYENLLNLLLNNDSHINFSNLMQSNQTFIQTFPAQQ